MDDLAALPTPLAQRVLLRLAVHLMALESSPEWEQQAPSNRFSLSAILAILELDNEESVISVKKIHKLGRQSADSLRNHFSQFGEIDKVILLPSKTKESQASRPASMGFLVFKNSKDAQSTIGEHVIDGVTVIASSFVKKEDRLTL
jgi:RNA recognition motif-containing protein